MQREQVEEINSDLLENVWKALQLNQNSKLIVFIQILKFPFSLLLLSQRDFGDWNPLSAPVSWTKCGLVVDVLAYAWLCDYLLDSNNESKLKGKTIRISFIYI